MVNSLDGRENNNKIFIDIENRHDRTGLTHYSIHSHRLRTIISKILRLFCCCFKTTHEYRTANQELRSSYFGFETFEINLNEKVYYITKASYEKWKLANLLPFFNSDFSQDFLQLIKTSKVTLNSKETDPKGLKAEISGPGFKITHLSHSEQGELPQDINLSHAYQDADFNNLWKRTDLFHNLSGSTSVSQNPDSQASTPLVVNDAQTLIAAFEREDKELKTVLPSIEKEIFKEAIVQQFGTQQINALLPDFAITSKIKNVYPLLNEEQIDILIQNMASPEWTLECFPYDENLMKKVSDKISTDMNQMRSFFKDIDRFIAFNSPANYRKELAITLIKKFAEIENTEGAAKQNPFGLKTDLIRIETEQSLIDLILNATSLQIAFDILLRPLENMENHAAYVLTVLKKVYAFTRDALNYSSDRTNFSFALLEKIKASNKARQIFDNFLDFNDGVGPVKQTLLTFANSCIIAALRTNHADEYLDFLMNHYDLMILVKPTLDKPNVALTNNLSPQEKERFLSWANRNLLMSGAAFPREREEDPNLSDVPRDMA